MIVEPRESSFGDWQLERYLLAELPASEMDAIRAAVAHDERLGEHLAVISRSSAAILVRYPSRPMAAAIRARLGTSSPPRARGRALLIRRPALLAFGAAALVAGTILVRAPQAVVREPDVTRVKGLAPRLLVYRRTGPSAGDPLTSGSAARGDDVVQIAYGAAGRRFGVIVSVDGWGVVTRHLPVNGSAAAELSAAPLTMLPQAYQLDDAPGYERFYFVTCSRPFTVEDVVSAIGRRSANSLDLDDHLDLPAAFDQFSFLLRKEPPR
jgi:hypothetical protein